MDTIFYNGIIHTLDKAYPEVSALAIKDGVILRLGSDEEILALKEPPDPPHCPAGQTDAAGLCGYPSASAVLRNVPPPHRSGEHHHL